MICQASRRCGWRKSGARGTTVWLVSGAAWTAVSIERRSSRLTPRTDTTAHSAAASSKPSAAVQPTVRFVIRGTSSAGGGGGSEPQSVKPYEPLYTRMLRHLVAAGPRHRFQVLHQNWK